MQSETPLKKHILITLSRNVLWKARPQTRQLPDSIRRHRFPQACQHTDYGGEGVARRHKRSRLEPETGTILVDHGHLRGLARTTGAVWGVPAAPRETVFRGVAIWTKKTMKHKQITTRTTAMMMVIMTT